MDVSLPVDDDEVEHWRQMVATREGLHVGYSAAANVCAAREGGLPKLMGAKRKATLKEVAYRGPFSRRQRRCPAIHRQRRNLWSLHRFTGMKNATYQWPRTMPCSA